MTIEHVLLVDDDEAFLSVLGRSLERKGISVSRAHTQVDASYQARRKIPSHAVLDLKLGEDSGLHVIPDLLAINAELRIIILTGYSSIATAVEAIKLGAADYLCKPAGVGDIIAALLGEVNSEINIAENPPSVDRLEWEHIQRVLQEQEGNVSATARVLGMHRRTLQRKLQKRPVRQ